MQISNELRCNWAVSKKNDETYSLPVWTKYVEKFIQGLY